VSRAGEAAAPRAAAWRPLAALLGLAWLLGPAPAPAALPAAQAGDVSRIEAYLNDLTTLRSGFVQINPDGAMVTGELYYQRPDKMRLDYHPPSPILIVSDGWQIVYYDRKLEQVSYLFPSSTPLGFLLSDQIRLSGDVTVTDLAREAGELRVTLVQTDEPNQGSIELAFAENPMELRRWTVIDAEGQATNIVLDGLETGVPLDSGLFRFHNPKFYPGARN
jgi:outer membrane lipoprotein-sorting protein